MGTVADFPTMCDLPDTPVKEARVAVTLTVSWIRPADALVAMARAEPVAAA
jgi:hypothetical protein